MQLTELKNTELVALCAQQRWNRAAWLEFYNRFDERIWLVIYRECKARGIINKAADSKQIIEDLVQEVYVKLTDKECKALKNFIGASQNSIYTYLGVIARNVVRNHYIKMKAQKRPSLVKSLEEVSTITESGEKILFRDMVKSPYLDVAQNLSVEILKQEVEDILDHILAGKDKERNRLIFKLHLYRKFSPEEIAKKFKFGISSKRIGNLITTIKKQVRRELVKRMMEA